MESFFLRKYNFFVQNFLFCAFNFIACTHASMLLRHMHTTGHTYALTGRNKRMEEEEKEKLFRSCVNKKTELSKKANSVTRSGPAGEANNLLGQKTYAIFFRQRNDAVTEAAFSENLSPFEASCSQILNSLSLSLSLS